VDCSELGDGANKNIAVPCPEAGVSGLWFRGIRNVWRFRSESVRLCGNPAGYHTSFGMNRYFLAIPEAGDAGKKEQCGSQAHYLFFLAQPPIRQSIPIPRTGSSQGRGVFVGVAGTLTITTTGAGAGVGVGAVENTAGMLLTSGITTPVPLLADSDIAWHVPS